MRSKSPNRWSTSSLTTVGCRPVAGNLKRGALWPSRSPLRQRGPGDPSGPGWSSSGAVAPSQSAMGLERKGSHAAMHILAARCLAGFCARRGLLGICQQVPLNREDFRSCPNLLPNRGRNSDGHTAKRKTKSPPRLRRFQRTLGSRPRVLTAGWVQVSFPPIPFRACFT
jgi:hypothetical protein